MDDFVNKTDVFCVYYTTSTEHHHHHPIVIISFFLCCVILSFVFLVIFSISVYCGQSLTFATPITTIVMILSRLVYVALTFFFMMIATMLELPLTMIIIIIVVKLMKMLFVC